MKNTNRSFTLIEILISILIFSMIFLGSMSALYHSRITARKARYEVTMLDFGLQYCEMLRSIPFDLLESGTPINSLYDGTNSLPAITIPVNNSWEALNTNDYYLFHPDLLWLSNENPQLSVNIITTQIASEDHTKHIDIRIRWDSPLNGSIGQEQRYTLVRTKDVL